MPGESVQSIYYLASYKRVPEVVKWLVHLTLTAKVSSWNQLLICRKWYLEEGKRGSYIAGLVKENIDT